MNMVEHSGWGFFLANGESDVGAVLVHQIYGLDDYIKSVSARLATAGFSVAAVDLFRDDPRTSSSWNSPESRPL